MWALELVESLGLGCRYKDILKVDSRFFLEAAGFFYTSGYYACRTSFAGFFTGLFTRP
jgi:hypothetical protein